MSVNGMLLVFGHLVLLVGCVMPTDRFGAPAQSWAVSLVFSGVGLIAVSYWVDNAGRPAAPGRAGAGAPWSVTVMRTLGDVAISVGTCVLIGLFARAFYA